MSVNVHAQLLESGDGLVCCTYHPRQDANAVVLLVPPLGQLYYRCHLLYRQIAQRLVNQGQAVFRMDFRGQGDASGDFQLINQQSLIEDLQSVYAAIRVEFPKLPLWIVATDWSVVPVLQFCAQHSSEMKLWGLILAEPQLQGADYWQQQLGWQQAILNESLRFRFPRKISPNENYVEIAGHAYGQTWVKQIQATDVYACLDSIITKHRACIAGEQRLLPLKNYLCAQQQPRIQDHFTQLQLPPQWLDAAKVDASVQHAQWLQAIPDYIRHLR